MGATASCERTAWGGAGTWASCGTGPFQLWGCDSYETKTLTACLCPRALTCSFPKMRVQATFSIKSQEEVRASEGGPCLPPPSHSPTDGAFPADPIWSGPQLPSVHSLMLIPNRACAAGGWQGRLHPCVGVGREKQQ